MDEVDHPSLQLLGFCDMSQSAYAAVIYLKVTVEETRSASTLAAKTRVAFLKTVTIPRLEIQLALLPVRLIHSIKCALKDKIPLDPPTCFTDSRTALCWIRHAKKE